MAQPSETYDTYDAVGAREDLSDIIYNISPTETPFMSMIGRGKMTAVYSDWQIDTLAAVDTGNAVIQGDDATNDAVAATTRPGNRSQISDKVIVISGTQDVISKAGRKKELSYQLAKKSKELKRDMEAIMTRNQASLVGSAVLAPRSGSLEAWYETNVSRGGGAGASGGFNTSTNIVDAATNGTQRAIQESTLKTVISSCWTNGGNPTTLMCGAVTKANISAFTGNSTRLDKGEDKKLVAAIDFYVSDFGTHKTVPNRFQNDRTLHVLDPSLWSVIYLRSFRQHALAKTGDSEKRQLLVEWSLCSKNEAGSGVYADLTV